MNSLKRDVLLFNMNYAIYFNKKYKRVGHLWQGRFKSWFVTDDAYLYTLMLYMEQNPLKANRVKTLEGVGLVFLVIYLFLNNIHI